MEKITKIVGHARSLEWIVNKSIPVVIFFFGGSIQVGLAKFTPWLEAAGAIAYSALFFAGAFLSLLAYSLFLSTAKKRMVLNHATAVSNSSDANPLETTFNKKTINSSAFFSPFYIPHLKKRFQDCEIIGTGAIFLSGCLLKDLHFKGGQIILIDTKQPIINITIFDQCEFLGGRFINCTIFMKLEMYMSLPQHLKENLPVISISS